MELFEPQNFFQMAELLSNVFTGAIAIVGLLIALMTYKVAKEALTTWKQQKNHEYEVIIDSNIKSLVNIISDTYSVDKSYTSIFVLHASNFKYNSADYKNIEKKSKTLDSALQFIRMLDITKGKNKSEINSLISLINPAVVGLKNPVISSIFYDIKDYLENFDRVEKELISWTGFFISTTTPGGQINYIKEFESQYYDLFNLKIFEGAISTIQNKVDNYLRGRI